MTTINAASALEHAEYMARAGERLIEAMSADAALRIRIAESDDVSDDDEHDVQATVDERLRTMRNSIYEFRKRRDRALSTAVAEPPPLIHEQIDRAAKVLAELFDYPWERMPEEGREKMRENAMAVLEAAHGIQPAHKDLP